MRGRVRIVRAEAAEVDDLLHAGALRAVATVSAAARSCSFEIARSERMDEVVDDLRAVERGVDALALSRVRHDPAYAGIVADVARNGRHLVLGEQRQERPADDAGGAEHGTFTRPPPHEQVEVAATDRCVERALRLRVERARPPGRPGASGQARQVLLDGHAQLVAAPAGRCASVTEPPARSASNPPLDRVAARDDAASERQLRRAESEQRRPAEQAQPPPPSRQLARTPPRVKRSTACQ